jgi:hypothetical protein
MNKHGGPGMKIEFGFLDVILWLCVRGYPVFGKVKGLGREGENKRRMGGFGVGRGDGGMLVEDWMVYTYLVGIVEFIFLDMGVLVEEMLILVLCFSKSFGISDECNVLGYGSCHNRF